MAKNTNTSLTDKIRKSIEYTSPAGKLQVRRVQSGRIPQISVVSQPVMVDNKEYTRVYSELRVNTPHGVKTLTIRSRRDLEAYYVLMEKAHLLQAFCEIGAAALPLGDEPETIADATDDAEW